MADAVGPRQLDIYYSPTMHEVLEEVRRSHLSLDAQAEKAGITGATLRNWIGGRVHRPRVDTLEKMAASKGGRIGFIPGKSRLS